jgi:ribonuclease P protein component
MAISENHLYKKVYAKGSKAVCKHIVVYVLTDYHASRLARENPLKKRVNRVGLTVSTRLGGAVVRSRVRRIIRAAYQKLDKENNLKKGKLIVITARDSAATVKSTDIYADLLFAAKKLLLFDDALSAKTPEHARGKHPEQDKK